MLQWNAAIGGAAAMGGKGAAGQPSPRFAAAGHGRADSTSASCVTCRRWASAAHIIASQVLVLKNFQNSVSHRIFDRMHGTLNIDENKN